MPRKRKRKAETVAKKCNRPKKYKPWDNESMLGALKAVLKAWESTRMHYSLECPVQLLKNLKYLGKFSMAVSQGVTVIQVSMKKGNL